MLMLVPEGQKPGFLFRRLFLRQLSVEVRTQFAQSTKTGSKAEDLHGLASENDKYFVSVGATISSVSEASSIDENPNVNAVSGRQLCFYHRKFGKTRRSVSNRAPG